MTHQDIHDQALALDAQRVQDILKVDADHAAAKATLQAACGELGHLYTRPHFSATAVRTCMICGASESPATPAGTPEGPAP